MSELKGYLVHKIMKEDFLVRQLNERAEQSALRSLRSDEGRVDFFSNDYLGIVKNALLEQKMEGKKFLHGSRGSRLLAGNYPLIEQAESEIADFHQAPAALIFNSGYDANFGLMASVPGRGDLILYDKLCHASIRDGIRQSLANSHSFAHNDLEDLGKKIRKADHNNGRQCFVVTESVFSMDGDLARLAEIAELCEQFNANLIVDEAHATGVIGRQGEGLVQQLNLQNRCFARVHTFGKALGCHGAVVLGSETLRNFLINFSRPFIYSTALPPVSVAAIRAAYCVFPGMNEERRSLQKWISCFTDSAFKKSNSPIQCFIAPGNETVKKLAGTLLEQGYDVRPILSPTVLSGAERLRITLHSYNTEEDVKNLISLIQKPTLS